MQWSAVTRLFLIVHQESKPYYKQLHDTQILDITEETDIKNEILEKEDYNMQVDKVIRRYKVVVYRPNTDATQPAVSKISYTQRTDTVNQWKGIKRPSRTLQTFDHTIYYRPPKLELLTFSGDLL